MQDEDKNTELNGADVFSNWDQLMGGQGEASSPEIDALSLDNLMVDGGDAHWLALFQKTNLSDMDLVALKLVPNYDHDFQMEQAQLKSQMHLFLADLTNAHLNELRVAGLSEDQIGNLSKGILPVNWTVHLKYPVAYGGTIAMNNLVLIPQQPFHEELHHFLNRQLLTDAGVINPPVLYVPAPKTPVYVPFGSKDMATQVLHFETMGGTK